MAGASLPFFYRPNRKWIAEKTGLEILPDGLLGDVFDLVQLEAEHLAG